MCAFVFATRRRWGTRGAPGAAGVVLAVCARLAEDAQLAALVELEVARVVVAGRVGGPQDALHRAGRRAQTEQQIAVALQQQERLPARRAVGPRAALPHDACRGRDTDRKREIEELKKTRRDSPDSPDASRRAVFLNGESRIRALAAGRPPRSWRRASRPDSPASRNRLVEKRVVPPGAFGGRAGGRFEIHTKPHARRDGRAARGRRVASRARGGAARLPTARLPGRAWRIDF